MRSSPSAPRLPIASWLIAATVLGLLAGGAVLLLQQRSDRSKAEANASQSKAEEQLDLVRALDSQGNAIPESENLPPPAASLLPPEQHAPPGAMPKVKELANGDREVTLLDGLVVIQPYAERESFVLLRAGEPNLLGRPSGVLPDGSYICENIPTTIRREGHEIETLQRVRCSKIEGPIVDTEGAGQTPR